MYRRRRVVGTAVAGTAGAAMLLAVPGVSLAAPSAQQAVTDIAAASLRTTLNRLGAEHVYLATAAIAAALGGRTAEFQVAAGAVDENTKDLGKAVNAAYGAAAETRFLEIWRSHIGFFVDYTQGAAANDAAKKQKALADLNGYRQEIDAFLTGANPNLPRGAVAQLFAAHVQHLTAAIDALAAGNAAQGYAMVHMAAHQTSEIMDPLAAAIAKQMPAKFPGVPDSAASTLRSSLNVLGGEHVYLAGFAIAAALGGRTGEFQVAANATDQNSQELAQAVGSVYGSAAQTRFLEIWRSHIGFFVDYTQGAAAKDEAKKQKALADLNGYRQDIDAFLTGANPNLPRGGVAQLFAMHVTHLTGAIDALAAGNAAQGYAMLRQAAVQSQEIMDPLAGAIAAQFPARFPTTVAGAALPRTGGGPARGASGAWSAAIAGTVALLGGGALVRTLRRRGAA